MSVARVAAARADSAVIASSKRTCGLLTVNSRGENRDRGARGNFYFDTWKTNARKGGGKKINHVIIALLSRAGLAEKRRVSTANN